MIAASGWGSAGFRRVWRGEIGLYRAAYGLGGIGFILLSLVGDVMVAGAASMGGLLGILAPAAYDLAQMGFSVVAVVATCRAAHRVKPNGRRYGPIAIGLAFLFVGLQLVMTIVMLGLSSLSPSFATLDATTDGFLGLLGMDSEATAKLHEAQ